MIQFRQGNLLEMDAEALVNTVNCVGVMGKGIALQFRQKFPPNFKEYAKACRAGEVEPGRMFIVPTESVVNPKYIINFPTKRHWKDRSYLEDIESGLKDLAKQMQELGIASVAIPPLGCGNGGLEWSQVGPRIVSTFEQLPEVQVYLFAPQLAPAAVEMLVETNKPRMTRAKALLVALFDRYLAPGYELTKLEMQKLAYLLQASGEDMKLNFVKHQYGPYAENLNHLLLSMEGHYTRGFGDRAGRSAVTVMPEAAQEAAEVLKELPDARQSLDRVTKLIEGFESPYGLELLASVHYVTRHNMLAASDSATAISQVQNWNKRKRDLFESAHLQVAWNALHEEGWLE